jgi:sigma-70-like protein
MSELDALPADQRAAVQLLVKQGQSYDQLANLLGIDPAGVRTRAHAALDALGPPPGPGLDADARAEVADYLLGQQPAGAGEATRELLGASPDARDWASGVADALRPVAGDALPEVPSGAAPAPPAEPPAYEEEEEEPAAFDFPPRERPRRGLPTRDRLRERTPAAPGAPSSRLGGALLLAGLGIVIAVVIVLIINGGGDDGEKGSTVSRTAPTQTSTTGQRPIAQINLFSATGNSRQVGLAQVFQQGNRRALIVAGQGLRAGAYALWLYNSKSDARLLGFVPERVGSDGRFATQGELPGNAERFDKLVVTRERVTRETRDPPREPGTIVLQGDVKLG